jgi:hypothetical protein
MKDTPLDSTSWFVPTMPRAAKAECAWWRWSRTPRRSPVTSAASASPPRCQRKPRREARRTGSPKPSEGGTWDQKRRSHRVAEVLREAPRPTCARNHENAGFPKRLHRTLTLFDAGEANFLAFSPSAETITHPKYCLIPLRAKFMRFAVDE